MEPRHIIIAGQLALGVYALLLIVGGYIGYVKAGSRPSLIAGTISGIIALVALGLTWLGGFGFWIGLVLASALTVMFAIRFRKSGKFMPSGMLAAVSLLMIGMMVLALRHLG